MNKKVLVIISIIVIAAISFFAIFTNMRNNSNDIKKAIKYPEFKVTASSESNDLIALNTSFNLEASEDTTKELVETSFSISPSVEYEIEEVRNNYYTLTLKEELSPNTIYNVEYKTDKAPYKWSFQTQKIFDVSNFYPAEKNETNTNYVSTRTVIEIEFTYTPNDDIKNYFEITPKVEGKFEYDNRKIRFTPSNGLEYATTYTVKINSGFGNKENDEKLSEREYILRTVISDDIKMNEDIEFIDTEYGYAENKPIYLKLYTTSIDKYNVSIYQYENGKQFLEDLKLKKEFGNKAVLKKVDLTSLTKISEETIAKEELISSSWNYILPIKSKLAVGYYMLVVKANNVEYYLPLQINNITALTGYVDNDLLVWVNDLANNVPLENAKIKIDGKEIGSTNADGYLCINDMDMESGKCFAEEIYIDGRETLYSVIYNEDNKSTTDEYINVYTRLDRKTFKSGEEVHLWGFVKDRKGREFKDVILKVTPLWSDAVIEEKAVALDEFKTFETTFNVENYASGYYDVCVYVNGKCQVRDSFEIKDYDTNSYDVTVELDKSYVKGGENITCTVTAKLFDGSPLTNTKFVYVLNNENVERNLILDENGTCKFEIETNYSYPYNRPFYGNVAVKAKGIEDQESTVKSFTVYPNNESFDVEYRYNSKDNTVLFDIDTFMYDFSDMNNVKNGTPTSRSGYIQIEKYRYEKEVISSYYDENTKTTKYNYKINRVYDGNDKLEYTTTNGKVTCIYASPYKDSSEGYLEYRIFMNSENDGKTISMQYQFGAYLDEIVKTSEAFMGNYVINDDDYEARDKYKVNDNIVLKLQKINGELTGTPYILYLVKSSNGIDIITTTDVNYKLKFDKKYGANLVLKGYVFDGIAIREIGDYYYTLENEYSLSKEELKMDVDVKFDKTEYKPGDTVKIKVITKSDNKPVKASVNLSAVNKEYLAANANDTNILNSLYNNYYFNDNIMNLTHTVIAEAFNGGGGGGDGEIRSNFATTAFFETIYTDENGEAELELKLPDNVTTWDVSAQATIKDYKAVQINKDLKVTLPFFVTAIMNDKYLTGETPSINIRCNGNATTLNDIIKYTIKVTSPNGESKEINAESSVGKYANVSLGKLSNGTYEIIIKAESNGKTDAIKKSIEVVDTFQEAVISTNFELEANKKINVDKGVATLYFSNKDINSILDDLFYLVYMPKARNDQKVISYLADNVLRKLSNEKSLAKSEKFETSNGLSLLSSSSPDVLLSAKLASTGYFKGDTDLARFLNKIALDEKLDIRERLYAYWGLAALKEPVLKDLKELEKSIDFENNKYEFLILALSYADIGEYESANRIYNMYDTSSLSYTGEMVEYLAMLSFKINSSNRLSVYEKYKALNRETEYSNFVKLFRIQNEIQNSVEDGNVILTVNGEEKEIKVNGVTVVPYSITFKDNVYVKSKTDNIDAKLRRTEVIIPDKKDIKGILNKTYEVKGSEKTGDIVSVRISIDYSKLANGETVYVIEDVLPNSMKLTEGDKYLYDENIVKTPYKKDGQKLYFYVYVSENTKQYVEYEAIITSEGKYISDTVILKDMDDKVIDYTMPSDM